MYCRPKGDSGETCALMRRIDELFLQYPFYGSRQIVRHPGREGGRSTGIRCAGITCVPIRRGFPYLVVIMDGATRKVLF